MILVFIKSQLLAKVDHKKFLRKINARSGFRKKHTANFPIHKQHTLDRILPIAHILQIYTIRRICYKMQYFLILPSSAL